MRTEAFDQLAEKVLAGDANAQERAALRDLLAKDAKLKDQFQGLQQAVEFIQETAVIQKAINAPPHEIPAHCLRELQERVRQSRVPQPVGAPATNLLSDAYGWLRRLMTAVAVPGWAAAAVLLTLVIGGTFLIETRRTRSRPAPGGAVSLPAGIAAEMRSLLSLPTDRFLAALVLSRGSSVSRSSQSIPIYSPSSSTRALQPVILWRSEPEKRYDVTITDELDATAPLWQTKAVNSPLDFAKVEAWKDRPLAQGGLYRLRIQETERTVSPAEIAETTFKVLPGATASRVTTPQERIQFARHALTIDPVCFGDALAALMNGETRRTESELALKLKAVAFQKLGFEDEYSAAVRQLKALTGISPECLSADGFREPAVSLCPRFLN